MDDKVPASLSTFIQRKGSSEWSVQLINPTPSEPIRQMARDIFGGLDIEMTETDIEGVANDLFIVMRDDEVIASSPLKTLRETLLLVNSDLYATGTKDLDEIYLPDIVEELTDTVFTLEGYPYSNTEKLVLTLVSRHIEQQAARSQKGTLRTAFQRLSRLDDESGTREVYEKLAQISGLDVHVYGVGDWTPPSDFGPKIHTVNNQEIQDHWFVVYASEGAQDRAMLANKTGPYIWDGYWTTNTEEIQLVNKYITRAF